MLVLLECDTRQEEACPGALGWVCAACWCAGCAALCAQPLLLQAELAGRAQRGPSVGILAVATNDVPALLLLPMCVHGQPVANGSAVGRNPLPGGGAGSVRDRVRPADGLTHSSCASIRQRTITHNVPAERRNYLRN
ncbi:hypothetical protein evm_001359 [Chilo suppressalis]|nr:hypothetical protein evm_001359 [Chilo suppressalis]